MSTDRYRVVLIQPSVGISEVGGSLVVASELAKRLNQYFDIELLCGRDCGPWSYQIPCIPRSQAKHVIQNPILGKVLNKISTHPDIVIEHLSSFIPSLTRVLQKPPQLIFPHNDYGGLMVAACARYVKDIPVLFTEHNGLLADGICLRRNLRFHPDHLVVFDTKTADYARSIKPEQSLSVIPNGVDLERFSLDGPTIDLKLKKPVVLCVGSLNRSNHKRVELAIKAVSKLSEVSLLICGDGPDKNYYQNMGENLLGNDRFSITTVPYKQMSNVYRSADLFTLPSANEPFGLVYIEAMASGLPVVAPDEVSQKQIVNEGGFLCDVTNVDEYAATLKKSLAINWGQKPRQNSSKFGWDKVVEQYCKLIVNMIERRG